MISVHKTMYGQEAHELAEALGLHDGQSKEVTTKLTVKCKDVEGRTVISLLMDIQS